MQEGAIYIIENVETGKGYIGQTTRSVEQRFKEHCKSFSGCLKLRNAIQKYGQECFAEISKEPGFSKGGISSAIRKRSFYKNMFHVSYQENFHL
jgi:hypothetical protein